MRSISKKNTKNPLITWVSTDQERLACEPLLRKSSRAPPVKTTVIEWLKYLESPDTVNLKGKLIPKTEIRRREDLKTLEKFWKIAHGRAIMRLRFSDPRIGNNQIITEVYEKTGIRLSKQQIILIRRGWDVELKTMAERRKRLSEIVADNVIKNPDRNFIETSRELDLPSNSVYHLLKQAGVDKEKMKVERIERLQQLKQGVLDYLGIRYDRKERIGSSISHITSTYQYVEDQYNYRIRNYFPFMVTGREKLERNIELLEENNIDWRDYDLELWNLLGGNTANLRKKMDLFSAVGAPKELHYLLLGAVFYRLEFYSCDNAHCIELRNAVVRKDVSTIMKHARQLAYLQAVLNGWGKNEEYFDIATYTSITVLAECRNRENNPAFVLTLIANAIKSAIKNRSIELARTESIQSNNLTI